MPKWLRDKMYVSVVLSATLLVGVVIFWARRLGYRIMAWLLK